MKKQLYISIFLLLSISSNHLFAQFGDSDEISSYAIKTYEKKGFFYMGDNTFTRKYPYTMDGKPMFLMLSIDPGESMAMLMAFVLDCDNARVMNVAYKRYDGEIYIEKDHFLFEHIREWKYPVGRSKLALVMSAMCD